LINKACVYWDYSVESNYWASTVFNVDTVSVNSFGLHEHILKDENIWFVDTPSALNLAARKTLLYGQPPRMFEVETGLAGLHRKIGSTVRLVDSFYNITSASGWRFVEHTLDMDKGQINYELSEAATANGFYLDISFLDGDDLLL